MLSPHQSSEWTNHPTHPASQARWREREREREKKIAAVFLRSPKAKQLRMSVCMCAEEAVTELRRKKLISKSLFFLLCVLSFSAPFFLYDVSSGHQLEISVFVSLKEPFALYSQWLAFAPCTNTQWMLFRRRIIKTCFSSTAKQKEGF